MNFVEAFKINKSKDSDCRISELVETLNIIREKYGDIDIVTTSEYTCEICQICIYKQDKDDSYFAEISYFTDK